MNKAKYFKLLTVFILSLFSYNTFSSSKNNIGIFTSSNYETIINKQDNRPFYMLFWSIDCPPCIKKMEIISKLNDSKRKQYIFVSTDGDEFITEVQSLLKTLNLGSEKNWIFDSNSTQKIISTVDKKWYGETPRSYYFDSKKTRTRIKHP